MRLFNSDMTDDGKYNQIKVETLEKFLDHADTMLLHGAGNLSYYITKYELSTWDDSPVVTLIDLYSCARQLKDLLTSKVLKPTTEEVKNSKPGCIPFTDMELTLINTTIVALESYRYDLKDKWKILLEVH
jgi:hypothetical protein